MEGRFELSIQVGMLEVYNNNVFEILLKQKKKVASEIKRSKIGRIEKHVATGKSISVWFTLPPLLVVCFSSVVSFPQFSINRMFIRAALVTDIFSDTFGISVNRF